MAEVIKIDVWSDIACPWCYIGKRRLEQALETFAGAVEIEYHSFELAPDTPSDYAGTQAELLAEYKRVPIAQAHELLAQVTDVAASEGLAFDYDSLHPANTVLAHEALHYAKQRGLQGELKERILAAYFEHGVNLNEATEIAKLAAEIGLDRVELLSALENKTYLAAVKADHRQAIAYGISGVPFYILDSRVAISGAQPVDVFLKALNRAASLKRASA